MQDDLLLYELQRRVLVVARRCVHGGAIYRHRLSSDSSGSMQPATSVVLRAVPSPSSSPHVRVHGCGSHRRRSDHFEVPPEGGPSLRDNDFTQRRYFDHLFHSRVYRRRVERSHRFAIDAEQRGAVLHAIRVRLRHHVGRGSFGSLEREDARNAAAESISDRFHEFHKTERFDQQHAASSTRQRTVLVDRS